METDEREQIALEVRDKKALERLQRATLDIQRRIGPQPMFLTTLESTATTAILVRLGLITVADVHEEMADRAEKAYSEVLKAQLLAPVETNGVRH